MKTTWIIAVSDWIVRKFRNDHRSSYLVRCSAIAYLNNNKLTVI